MTKLATLSSSLGMMLVAGPAFAHPGEHGFPGFAAGVGHVLGHADHVLALIAILAVAALAIRPGLRRRFAELLKRRSR